MKSVRSGITTTAVAITGIGLLAACAAPGTRSASSAPVTMTPPSAPASAPPIVPATVPHFATPDDAMRYLVAAYNDHDMTAERHVTTPDSRGELETERQWVKTFSFNSCTQNPGGGDYSCQLDMATMVQPDDPNTDMREIMVVVAPAARTGWYMYTSEGCGDAPTADSNSTT